MRGGMGVKKHYLPDTQAVNAHAHGNSSYDVEGRYWPVTTVSCQRGGGYAYQRHEEPELFLERNQQAAEG